MSLTHSPSIPTENLIHCVDANNIKSYPGSGVVISDLSLQKTPISLKNGAFVSTEPNGINVFDFDGIDDRLDDLNITTNVGLTAYSTSMWINMDSSTAGVDVRFFWHGSYTVMVYKPTSDGLNYYLRTNNTAVNNGLGAGWFTTRYNQWIHMVFTYDGASKKIYINGLFVQEAAITGALVNSAGTRLSYASFPNATDFATKCKMGNMHVYTKALSDIEIKQLFEAHRGRYKI